MRRRLGEEVGNEGAGGVKGERRVGLDVGDGWRAVEAERWVEAGHVFEGF